MATWAERLRTWRRRLKAGLPYVRRREHRVLQTKYAELIEAVDGGAGAATDARLRFAKALPAVLEGEVCLFVSHAATPSIKPHVRAHVAELVNAGIAVVLILNIDEPTDAFALDGPLVEQASAIVFRDNTGFDFGAWAHLLSVAPGVERWRRLYLVNDSIVGPLDRADFARLIGRIRAADADVIGLTEALLPVRHLQSYFLAFGPRALQSGAVQRLFSRVRNWRTKRQVIDIHEARLTALLESEGLRCLALFPSLSGDPLSSDDTSLRWAELLQAGFPYLKTRVIASHADDPRIKAALSARP
jgi:hypothetical protein